MNTTKGSSQASKAVTTNSAGTTLVYFTRFCSDPLNQTSISANTWNYVFGAQQSNTGMNFPIGAGSGSQSLSYVIAYVWRPSTGAKVSDIFDSASNADFGISGAATTSEVSYSLTFGGSAVTCQVGDIICFEVSIFFNPSAGSKTGTFYYDGTTDPSTTDGTAVSSAASYIETPQTIAFSGGGGPQNITKSLTETIAITESPALKRTMTKVRAPATESINLSGTVLRLVAKVRSNTENTNLVGTLSRIRGVVRNRWSR